MLEWYLPVGEWRLGAEISCSRSFPLISEHCLYTGRRLAVRWDLVRRVGTCHYVAGTRFGSWRPWGRILFFAGATGHFRALGSRLCGSGGWVRKFLVSRLFPLISERCLHTGRRQAVHRDLVRRVETCPYVAGTRFGSWRPWGRILILAGVTGHLWALGSCLCGSGGLVRKIHVPAHFRSFPSVAYIQAGAGCSLGAWYGGLKPALSWLGHGLVAGGPGAGFCLLRA